MVNAVHMNCNLKFIMRDKRRDKENGQLGSSTAKTNHRQFTVLWCGSRGLFVFVSLFCLCVFDGVRSKFDKHLFYR